MINATERLARRVRAAMGDHNNDDLPVTQCVINMRKEVVSLQAECEQLRKYAAFYRRLRSLTYEQLGQPGVPCVAVPEADNRGHYVAGEDLDAAMQETSHDNQ